MWARTKPPVCVCVCLPACVRAYVRTCMCACVCAVRLTYAASQSSCCVPQSVTVKMVEVRRQKWTLSFDTMETKKKGQKHFLSHKEYNLWIVENSETVWHAWSTRMRAQSPRNGRQSHVSAQRSHSAELGMQPCSLERFALIRPFHCGRRMDEGCRVRTIRSIRVLSHYVSQFSQYFWFCVSLLPLWDRAVIFDALLE